MCKLVASIPSSVSGGGFSSIFPESLHTKIHIYSTENFAAFLGQLPKNLA
jgi:hypothetical protein